jgi:hypothetical protein
MGLADLILGKTNPFAAFVDQNHNSIRNAGAQFAQGTSLGGALSGAAQGYAQGAPIDDAYATAQKAEQQRLDDIAKTSAWLKQNYPQYAALPPEQGFEIASKLAAQKAAAPTADPSSVAEYKFYANQELGAKRQPLSYDDWRKGSNQTARGALNTPLPFRDAAGNYHAIQQFTDGTTIDLSTGKPMDQSLTYDPFGYAGKKTSATVDAKTAGAARAALPSAENAYQQTLSVLGKLTGPTADPNIVAGQAEQFGKTLGIPTGQIIGAIPSTHKSDFRNIIDQLSGQAFLNIRQALKGAGQVTDYEGAKGEVALSRMKAAAQSGSEEDFNQALLDYKEAIDNGLRLLRETANGAYSEGQPAVTGSPLTAPGAPSTGVPDPVAAADALLNSGKY